MVKTRINLTGKRFGKLLVLKQAEDYVQRNGKREAQWKCKCDCGNITKVKGYNLRSGYTKSCGCLRKEYFIEGDANRCEPKRLYRIYRGMIARCETKSCSIYDYYGGRGIKICKEWRDKKTGFANFRNWSLENGYADDLSIDRIDVNGNYEPSNCRWATQVEQRENKRKYGTQKKRYLIKNMLYNDLVISNMNIENFINTVKNDKELRMIINNS